VAQHDYVIANGTGAAVRSDLNNALAAIVSNNSGATEPATMYAYQWWADTSTGLLKLRNAANNAWITLRELDGTLTIEAGTVSAPGLAFASDLNTGIYSPSADQLAIATNGVERVEWGTSEVVFNDGGANYDFRIEGDTNSSLFFVDASAEAVGIGTTSPAYALDIQGSQGVGLQIYEISSGINRRLQITQESSGVTYDATYSSTGNAHRWLIGGGEAARLDGSGRLLVGTSSTSDVARLLVQGNSGGGAGAVDIQFDSASPASGTTIGTIRFKDTTASTFYGTIDCVADAATGAADKPGRLVFSTTADGASSPTERMRIKENGQVWINSTANIAGTSASTMFQVTATGADFSAAITNTNATPIGLFIRYSTAANNTGSEFLYCADSSALRASIRSNGGLANYSANDVNLSDINTKKDISLATGTWDCLKDWEIVNFRYKDQSDDADLNLGVIAQQVAESCPEVITVFQEAKEATETEPAQEERLGVKEQQMMWMAIKALQEAQLRIETLEAEVAALKAQ
jgi:hypothetical protein